MAKENYFQLKNPAVSISQFLCAGMLLYINILLYTQGGKHAASPCKGGIYPYHDKKGSTRKREQMIRGDKHKRKIAFLHRGRTREYGPKRGGGILKGCRRF